LAQFCGEQAASGTVENLSPENHREFQRRFSGGGWSSTEFPKQGIFGTLPYPVPGQTGTIALVLALRAYGAPQKTGNSQTAIREYTQTKQNRYGGRVREKAMSQVSTYTLRTPDESQQFY
jgi:hypothetical protein